MLKITPAEAYNDLKASLQDFFQANGFTKAIVGVSGGLDSAMVAVLAADILGGENVLGIAMPSPYSSEHSLTDAQNLMKAIGGPYRVQPIEPMFTAFKEALDLSGVAEENIQARIRGMILMSTSNMEGGVVLATGNRSEALVGYCTMYGDTVGGFAPLATTFKSDLYLLAQWRNEQGEVIPPNTLRKAPSAELAPGQFDQNVLPDYPVLDAILTHLVDGGPKELITDVPTSVVDDVKNRMASTAWKRLQCAPGPKLG